MEIPYSNATRSEDPLGFQAWQIAIDQVLNAQESVERRAMEIRREGNTWNKRAERERKAQARRAQQKRTEDQCQSAPRTAPATPLPMVW